MRQLKITSSTTNRENQSLETYLQEIRKVDLLTPEEEVILAQRIKQGDQAALETLTKANLRFVVSVAKQYQNQGLSLNDMINEGNLGLRKAAEKFDETMGFKFISYAVWWIRQTILTALQKKSRVTYVTEGTITLSRKISKATNQLLHELQREPSLGEIAERCGLDEKKVEETMASVSAHLSIDAPLGDESTQTYADMMSSGDPKDKPSYQIEVVEACKQEVALALSTALTEREELVTRMLYGIGYPHSYSETDIKDMLHLSLTRVKQIRNKAKLKLRSYKRRNPGRLDFLDDF